MDEVKAKAICEKNGSTLRSYERGRAAFLVLPSGEPIVISVGTASAKVFTSSTEDWHLPKVIVSQPIEVWEPSFRRLDRLHRYACGYMVLDGLLSLLSRCRSIDELRLSWPGLENPIGVAGRELITYCNDYPESLSGPKRPAEQDKSCEVSDFDDDFENRILCSDDSCTGTIGEDGRCRYCGKPGPLKR